MSDRQRKLPNAQTPRRSSDRERAVKGNLPHEKWDRFDLRELVTGAFVVSMILLGSGLHAQLYREASNLLTAQIMFEFPMALLAVCAGQAIRQPTKPMRIACVAVGVVGVLLSGTSTAIQGDAPWMIASGAWLVGSRTMPTKGVIWFSVEHCRAIEVTAMTSWACLIAAFLLLMLLTTLLPPRAPGGSAPAIVFALTWGAYYVGLGLLLPRVRKRLEFRQRH